MLEGQKSISAAVFAILVAAVTLADQPTIAYETVVTGFNMSYGQDVAVDDLGNAYIIARAYDQDNDIVVAKLSPDGTLLWTNEIRGNSHDIVGGITVDGVGDVYITGWTDSDDFPTLNALDGTLTGFRDAFIAKLSTQDGTILFSTYLGGDYVDGGNDIALNDAGEIYIVGFTESSDFPTVDPLQGELNSPPYQYSDVFVSKLSADGGTLLYSTYLGGSDDDSGVSIALDENDRIYVAGHTESADFPTASPIQPTNAGGQQDLFVARLAADGSALEFGTYLGGEDWDTLGRIALDDAGSVYLAGATRSIGFPTTAGAFQEEFVGEILGCEVPFGADHNCEDVFVTKLTPGGTALAYSTFLAGGWVEECRGIAVDGNGCAYVVGYTYSPDFPPDGIDSSAEIFASKLNSDGSDLVYTVTIDSGSANAGHGIALDAEGGVYFTGAVNVPAEVYVAKIDDAAAGIVGDLDGDGDVDLSDLAVLLGAYGTCAGAPDYDIVADLDASGCIDLADLAALLENYGASG
jgi:hypothetical protein